MIHETVKNHITEAMKAKDAATLRAARNLVTALTNEAVALGKTPQDMLDDEAARGVIKRLAKQRKDSIEQFRAGDREDLIPPEEEELAYLTTFLPEMMSLEEIRAIAQKKKEELGIDDTSKMGQLMGAIMKETKGQADGSDVKTVVEEILGE